MKILRFCFLIVIAISINSFAAQKGSERLRPSYALPGTSTAVVGIALDEKGFPLETVSKIILKPGQKVIFAGPDRFQIVFKNKKSPASTLRYSSKNGVITIMVPRDIFESRDFKEEIEKTKVIKFDYSIIVNGKELDPPMIIQREG